MELVKRKSGSVLQEEAGYSRIVSLSSGVTESFPLVP